MVQIRVSPFTDNIRQFLKFLIKLTAFWLIASAILDTLHIEFWAQGQKPPRWVDEMDGKINTIYILFSITRKKGNGIYT